VELLRVVEDEQGKWYFHEDSLAAIYAAAALEGTVAKNPYSSIALAPRLVASEEVSSYDPLAWQAYPSYETTCRLVVDVCIRLQVHGIHVEPEVLCSQRIGRMKRLFHLASDLFLFNFTKSEQILLSPPSGILSSFVSRWTNWASWTQAVMLAFAKCAGERSEAPELLKKRGAAICLVALSQIIPEFGYEFREHVQIQG